MKKLLFFMIIFSLIFFVNCATEHKATQPDSMPQEKCDAPVWRDGDSWKFISGSETWEERITKEDNRIKVRQTPKKEFLAFFNIPIIGLKIFPIWVGKKTEGIETLKTVEGIDLQYFYSFKVNKFIGLKVEAGTFECYEIEFKISPSFRSEEGIGFFYYAPETKSIVKFKTKSSILHRWRDYELLSFNVN